MSRNRPRAHKPGEGHRFLGTATCVHCGRAQRDLIIRRLCPVGVLYVFKGRQGAFSFDRARTITKLGI